MLLQFAKMGFSGQKYIALISIIVISSLIFIGTFISLLVKVIRYSATQAKLQKREKDKQMSSIITVSSVCGIFLIADVVCIILLLNDPLVNKALKVRKNGIKELFQIKT